MPSKKPSEIKSELDLLKESKNCNPFTLTSLLLDALLGKEEYPQEEYKPIILELYELKVYDIGAYACALFQHKKNPNDPSVSNQALQSLKEKIKPREMSEDNFIRVIIRFAFSQLHANTTIEHLIWLNIITEALNNCGLPTDDNYYIELVKVAIDQCPRHNIESFKWLNISLELLNNPKLTSASIDFLFKQIVKIIFSEPQVFDEPTKIDRLIEALNSQLANKLTSLDIYDLLYQRYLPDFERLYQLSDDTSHIYEGIHFENMSDYYLDRRYIKFAMILIERYGMVYINSKNAEIKGEDMQPLTEKLEVLFSFAFNLYTIENDMSVLQKFVPIKKAGFTSSYKLPIHRKAIHALDTESGKFQFALNYFKEEMEACISKSVDYFCKRWCWENKQPYDYSAEVFTTVLSMKPHERSFNNHRYGTRAYEKDYTYYTPPSIVYQLHALIVLNLLESYIFEHSSILANSGKWSTAKITHKGRAYKFLEDLVHIANAAKDARIDPYRASQYLSDVRERTSHMYGNENNAPPSMRFMNAMNPWGPDDYLYNENYQFLRNILEVAITQLKEILARKVRRSLCNTFPTIPLTIEEIICDYLGYNKKSFIDGSQAEFKLAPQSFQSCELKDSLLESKDEDAPEQKITLAGCSEVLNNKLMIPKEKPLVLPFPNKTHITRETLEAACSNNAEKQRTKDGVKNALQKEFRTIAFDEIDGFMQDPEARRIAIKHGQELLIKFAESTDLIGFSALLVYNVPCDSLKAFFKQHKAKQYQECQKFYESYIDYHTKMSSKKKYKKYADEFVDEQKHDIYRDEEIDSCIGSQKRRAIGLLTRLATESNRPFQDTSKLKEDIGHTNSTLMLHFDTTEQCNAFIVRQIRDLLLSKLLLSQKIDQSYMTRLMYISEHIFIIQPTPELKEDSVAAWKNSINTEQPSPTKHGESPLILNAPQPQPSPPPNEPQKGSSTHLSLVSIP